MVLKVQGSPRDILTVEIKKPEEKEIKISLSELLEGDYNVRAQGKSLKIHRIVPVTNASTSFSITDDSSGDQVDWYYIRAMQKNEQLAWSSPIWVEKKV